MVAMFWLGFKGTRALRSSLAIEAWPLSAIRGASNAPVFGDWLGRSESQSWQKVRLVQPRSIQRRATELGSRMRSLEARRSRRPGDPSFSRSRRWTSRATRPYTWPLRCLKGVTDAVADLERLPGTRLPPCPACWSRWPGASSIERIPKARLEANPNAQNSLGATPLHYATLLALGRHRQPCKVCLRKSNWRGIANLLLENGPAGSTS